MTGPEHMYVDNGAACRSYHTDFSPAPTHSDPTRGSASLGSASPCVASCIAVLCKYVLLVASISPALAGPIHKRTALTYTYQCSQWAGQAGLKLGRARPVLTMTSPGRPKFSGRQHHRPSLPG